MPTDEELDAAVADAILNPKRVKGDQGEVEEHNMKDLIAARKFIAEQKASASGRGFTIRGFTPGSAVGGER